MFSLYSPILRAYLAVLPQPADTLPAGQASLLCHGSVLFLKPVTQSLRPLHVLVYASHNAAFFARGKGLALEAVDAGIKAVLDEVGVHLVRSQQRHMNRSCFNATHVHKLLHLLLLHARLKLALLCCGKTSTRSATGWAMMHGKTHESMIVVTV